MLVKRAGGRPALPEARSNTTAATATLVEYSAASSNEIKLFVKFCKKTKCDPHNVDCYCCLKPKPEQTKCYIAKDDCKANCPVCNPKCPPPEAFHQPDVEGQPSHVTTNSTMYS
jgi:hypothetical protein